MGETWELDAWRENSNGAERSECSRYCTHSGADIRIFIRRTISNGS